MRGAGWKAPAAIVLVARKEAGVLDRLSGAMAGFTHGGDEREHEAVVELLLLVMYADRQLRIAEKDEIDAFADAHQWETATFSVSQYLGPATAKVRRALDSVLSVNALLADIDERVVHSALRTEALAACRVVAQADGTIGPDEQAMLDKIAAHLSR